MPVPAPRRQSLTDVQKAKQEALNTLLQYDRMIALIREYANIGGPFRLRPSIILELNRISIQRLEADAGRWRDVEMLIGDSSHVPPSVNEVPTYVDQLCDYVNDHWHDRSPLHLAAYIMWRLNWIHPFVDGNGRTTRAVSYYVLCCKLGFYLPGVTTIPELISTDKRPYYEALEAADRAYQRGDIDVSEMEILLRNLLARQMIQALNYAGMAGEQQTYLAPTPIIVEQQVRRVEHREPTAHQVTDLSTTMSLVFAGMALLFFMILVLRGQPVVEQSRWLVIIVLAFAGALSVGFLGGTSNVRGSIPLSKEFEGYKVKFSVTGGIGALVLLLILGWFLFLSKLA